MAVTLHGWWHLALQEMHRESEQLPWSVPKSKLTAGTVPLWAVAIPTKDTELFHRRVLPHQV